MKLLISNQKPAKGYSGALLHDHSVVEKHTHFVVKEPLLLWPFYALRFVSPEGQIQESKNKCQWWPEV